MGAVVQLQYLVLCWISYNRVFLIQVSLERTLTKNISFFGIKLMLLKVFFFFFFSLCRLVRVGVKFPATIPMRNLYVQLFNGSYFLSTK